jgi:hypothetical protein
MVTRSKLLILAVLPLVSCKVTKPTTSNEDVIAKQNARSQPMESLQLMDGTADTANTYKNSVFAIGYSTSGVSTAFVAIRQKRCLVTAAHAYPYNAPMEAVSVDQSVVPYKYNERQWIAAGTTRWRTDGDAADKKPFSDVGILWLENRQNLATGPKTRIDTYVPLQLASTPPSKMPTNLTVVGYGTDERGGSVDSFRSFGTVTFDAYLNPFIELGSDWMSDRKDVPKGSLYITNDNDGAKIMGGDSGGPALEGNVVYALVHGFTRYNETVWLVGDYLFAGVDKYANSSGKLSNYEWLYEQADFICTKSLSVYLKTGVASIVGTTIRPVIHKAIQANGKINLAADNTAVDGIENIHEGMVISLSATLQPGYSFVEWEGPDLVDSSGMKKNLCPCHGSKNPVCTVSFDSIGIYDESRSIDNAQCGVVALQSGGTGGGTGAGPGTSTDTGAGTGGGTGLGGVGGL